MSEVRIEDQLTIAASTQEVWQAIADPASHVRWHPFVTEISGGQRLGDVRMCSVLIGGKRGETRERCVVEDQGSRIAWLVEEDSTGFGRMVSNWDEREARVDFVNPRFTLRDEQPLDARELCRIRGWPLT